MDVVRPSAIYCSHLQNGGLGAGVNEAANTVSREALREYTSVH